jgi:ABC-type uncharacterized transport system ATPase subunit
MPGARRLGTRQITKQFGAFTAVSDVSLSFEPGLIHAVLGENGAGKSTLMKLLFGLHEPTSGEVTLDGEPVVWRSSMDAIRAGLGMVQQHFTLVEPLSAIDNIMLGAETTSSFGRLNRKQAIARIEGLLPSQNLAVPWMMAIQDMTVGQKQRVEILKLLFRESQILFLDEPTAVLTPSEIEEFFQVLRELRKQGRTIVLITHKINEVLQVCDTYTILRAGKFNGSGLVAETSVESIVEKMIGRQLPEFDFDRSPALAQTVLSCRGVNGIDLEVRAGEIVGIAGVEGSGQTQFVDAIMGLKDFEGELQILGESIQPLQARAVRELGVGLVPEDRLHQGLWLDHSCFDNMVIGLEDQFLKNHIFQRSRLEASTADWAKDYDVRSANLHVPVGSLSGGNQQKVIFAREVTGRKPKFLICFQPTRGVDLGAIDLIHRKLMELRAQGLGILLLSSELDELLKLSDRLAVFFDGKVNAEFSRAEFDRMRVGRAMTGTHEQTGAT